MIKRILIIRTDRIGDVVLSTPTITAVRKAFPEMVFHIDCNSAFTLDDLPMFEQLDRYNLAMIEQPLAYDDLIDHAELQKRINTPICLDESITSLNKARKAIQIGACRWINLKPGRVGGLTNALEIHNICRAAGIPCWVGGMLESGLGASFLKALATLPNIKYPCDIFRVSLCCQQQSIHLVEDYLYSKHSPLPLRRADSTEHGSEIFL